jgi:uncharacterized membrane protein YkvA (DUF1232 family)
VSTRTEARSRAEQETVHAADAHIARPRRGARRTVLHAIRQIPHYLRLLFGLMGDVRVSTLNKLLVAGAIAYTLSPLDLIPDYIPFLGQVDDIFLLVTAMQRLIDQAGRRLVRSHWTGDVAELADLNLKATLAAAAFFLPGRMRRKLRRLGRGQSRWPF